MTKRRIQKLAYSLVAGLTIAFINTQQAIATEQLSQQQSDKLLEAANLIYSRSLYPIDEDQLIEAAIQAMVDTSDKYSRYYPPENYEEQVDEFDGNGFGTGLVLQQQGDSIVVAYISPNTPATHRWRFSQQPIIATR